MTTTTIRNVAIIIVALLLAVLAVAERARRDASW